MIYLILLILILTIILYFIYKDYLTVLKITSIVTVASAVFTFASGYVLKYFALRKLGEINISDVVQIILFKFVINGIYLLILGLIEFFFYFVISYMIQRKKETYD